MLGHLGPFPVRWYGLFMGLATLAGMVIVAVRFARRGIDPWRVFPMLIFAVPLGIIGARLFNVIDDFGFYRSDPGAIVSLPLGGLAIYGVIVGGVGGIVAYCWWRRLPILRVLDCLALAIPVGQLIGAAPTSSMAIPGAMRPDCPGLLSTPIGTPCCRPACWACRPSRHRSTNSSGLSS